MKIEFDGKYGRRRREIFDQIVENYDEANLVDPVFIEQVKVYATVIEQVERLTKFIDKNGMTYEYSTASGEVRIAKYPQAQALSQAQDRILSMGIKLKRYASKEKEEEKEEDDGLIK
jgi:hypothetical protein